MCAVLSGHKLRGRELDRSAVHMSSGLCVTWCCSVGVQQCSHLHSLSRRVILYGRVSTALPLLARLIQRPGVWHHPSVHSVLMRARLCIERGDGGHMRWFYAALHAV